MFWFHNHRGKTAEVGWGLLANHGGGYSYRLCKLEASRSELTEECFQKTPLRFANNLQWIQTGQDLSTRRYFVANRTTVGTYPPGSEWTKNPVTNCAGFYGGAFDSEPNCPNGFQFAPHLDGLWGEGRYMLFKSRSKISMFTCLSKTYTYTQEACNWILPD